MALLSWGLALGGWGCEEAFVTFAPGTKRPVEMALFPNNGRRGSDLSVVALLDIPSARRNFVVLFDAGAGVDQFSFNTGMGRGCEREGVDDLLALLGETRETRFAICFDVQISDSAPLGQRPFKLEINSDGEPIISRSVFSVLPALTQGQGLAAPEPDAGQEGP